MLLFWKAKLVVLAVPKTGTTALEEALSPFADVSILAPPEKKHVTARRYHGQLAPFFENRGARPLQTMAVIREPIDWLMSWYRYRARPEISGSATSTAGMEFEQFVNGWLSTPEPEYARIGRQSRFVADRDGMVIVDHLFRYEQLDHAVTFLEDRLGRKLTLPRRNISPPAKITLSKALETRLRREAEADFALWEKVGR